MSKCNTCNDERLGNDKEEVFCADCNDDCVPWEKRHINYNIPDLDINNPIVQLCQKGMSMLLDESKSIDARDIYEVFYNILLSVESNNN